MMNKKIIIDGDIIAYKASSAVQKDIDWGDGLWTCHAYLDDALDYAETLIKDIECKLGSDETVLAFSDERNFRKIVYPEYKANRKNKRKPTCYWALVNQLITMYPSHSMQWLEGDDVMGIFAHDNYIMVSTDKDMKTVKGCYYNFDKEVMSIQSEDDSIRNTFIQALTGDRADNYPGIAGYGPVKAKRLIDECKNTSDIRDFLIEKGIDKNELDTMYSLARIMNCMDEWTETKIKYNL